MGRKKHTPEEIVAKQGQVDVMLSQGRPVVEPFRTIRVTAERRRVRSASAGAGEPRVVL